MQEPSIATGLGERSADIPQAGPVRLPTAGSLLWPIAALTAGMIAVIAALLAFAVTEQNRLALRASAHLGSTAINGEVAALQAYVRDYAGRDAAVENLVLTLDETWASENVGAWAPDSLAIDATLVLDGADRPVYLVIDGTRQPDDGIRRVSEGLADLVHAARERPGAAPSPAAGAVLLDGVPALASAVAIVRRDGRPAAERGDAAAVLVHLRRLDGELLAALGARFLLSDLMLSADRPDPEGPAFTLLSAAGRPLGYLQWQADRPGLDMLEPLVLPGAAWLVLAAALLLTIVRRTHRTMRDLAAARHRAAAQRLVEAELQREAASASRAKAEFLALVSHELRTPLNSILGFSDMLVHALRDQGGKAREYAGYVRQGGETLLSLINDIIDLARAESDRLQLRERDVALRDVLERCVTLLQQQALDRGVEVRCSTAEIVARGDQRALKQIVTSLLSNAIKFTGRGGRIDVFAELTCTGVEIGVRDTGAGMTDAEMQRALEPFGQAEDTTTRAASGPGLGLNITRALAEAHGGHLVLCSASGVGTIATVRLPMERVLRFGIRRRQVPFFLTGDAMVAAAGPDD